MNRQLSITQLSNKTGTTKLQKGLRNSDRSWNTCHEFLIIPSHWAAALETKRGCFSQVIFASQVIPQYNKVCRRYMFISKFIFSSNNAYNALQIRPTTECIEYIKVDSTARWQQIVTSSGTAGNALTSFTRKFTGCDTTIVITRTI